jgi:hypothetical protein
MELYNGEATTLTIDLPAGSTGPVVVNIKRDGTVVIGPVNPVLADNKITVNIPYSQTILDGDLTIETAFVLDGNQTKTVAVRVITPILTISEIKPILPQASDDEIKRVERKVRSVIEAYTGQYFGKYSGTMNVYGSGDSFLYSPRRILSISGLVYNGDTVSTEGFTIAKGGWAITPIKGWLRVDSISAGDIFRSGPVIASPYGVSTFTSGIAYGITGTFGYEYVPFDVKEAARALINDYACQESLYRERYISDIRAADWRFAFNTGAFAGTGNVVADQILSGYQKNILAVI